MLFKDFLDLVDVEFVIFIVRGGIFFKVNATIFGELVNLALETLVVKGNTRDDVDELVGSFFKDI